MNTPDSPSSTPDDETRLVLGENAACLHIDGPMVQVVLPKSMMGKMVEPGSSSYDVALCAFFLSAHPIAVLARSLLTGAFNSILEKKLQPLLTKLGTDGENRNEDFSDAMHGKPPVPPSNLH